MSNKILNRKTEVYCGSVEEKWGAYIRIHNHWNVDNKKEYDILEYEMYGEGDTIAAIVSVAKWLVLNHYDKDKTIFYTDDRELLVKHLEYNDEGLDGTLAIILNQPNFYFQCDTKNKDKILKLIGKE